LIVRWPGKNTYADPEVIFYSLVIVKNGPVRILALNGIGWQRCLLRVQMVALQQQEIWFTLRKSSESCRRPERLISGEPGNSEIHLTVSFSADSFYAWEARSYRRTTGRLAMDEKIIQYT
jgi:hypothetical protein